MGDASRALPAHLVGTTPTQSRSIPITDIEGLDGAVEDAGFLKVPAPPSTGPKQVLTSTAGVLAWEAAA